MDEIRDKLNDLSKIFSELNETEMRSVVLNKNIDDKKSQIDKLREDVSHKKIKIFSNIKIKKVSLENEKIEKTVAKNEETIKIQKEFIKEKINELLEFVNKSI
jgi:hypothetical protein